MQCEDNVSNIKITSLQEKICDKIWAVNSLLWASTSQIRPAEGPGLVAISIACLVFRKANLKD